MTIAPVPPPPSGCVFLDVDGTLIGFTASPFDTRADAALRELLHATSTRLNGALALVSGRSIAFLDRLFEPLALPCAGLHGVERRTAAGTWVSAGPGEERLDPVRERLRTLVREYPGTLLEDKGRSMAVHFRRVPQYEPALKDRIAGLAADLGPEYHVQAGSLLYEIKPRGIDKGAAVRAFLDEPPFHGRTPIYVGDDLTDLDGFAAVEAQGGISIGVGDRVRGRYQLADPAAVAAWLARTA